ncbi:unnamed protein product, partial [Mycena citricolor]
EARRKPLRLRETKASRIASCGSTFSKPAAHGPVAFTTGSVLGTHRSFASGQNSVNHG